MMRFIALRTVFHRNSLLRLILSVAIPIFSITIVFLQSIKLNISYLISNSFYRQVYYPMVHSTIRRQFCLFFNSLCSLCGFICIVLHCFKFFCFKGVRKLRNATISIALLCVCLFTWNNSAHTRQNLVKLDI
jgi:hypothetical protein